jgi:hypothetical protein
MVGTEARMGNLRLAVEKVTERKREKDDKKKKKSREREREKGEREESSGRKR